MGCNAEAYVKLMFYYFKGESKRPMCKEIMRVCEVHGRQISAEYTNVKIQVLA